MKAIKLSFVKIAYVLFIIFLSSGCDTKNISNIEVTLSESLRLDDFLAEDSVASGATKDILASQLSLPWSFSIELQSPESNTLGVVASCKDYLSEDKKAEPVRAHEYTTYRMLAISCEAVQQALSMHASNESFVRELTFDKTLADELPHAIALVISTEEKKRLDADQNIRVWSDVEIVESVEVLGDDVYSFKTQGATHTLKRLAMGDVNGDGIEDLMIRTDITLDEGSYSASRLFVLTKRSAEQDIEVLQSF